MDSYQGGCACGSVRYRIFGDPVLVAGCCCRDCARSSGAPYTVWVGVVHGMIEFPERLPVERETSSKSARGHCPECGTQVTFRRIRAESEVDPLFYVTAASLDEPDRVHPTEVIYYDERPSWLNLSPDLPTHPGASPLYGSPKRHRKLH